MIRRKSMKKILLPAVTAFILVFSMAVSAMAELVPALDEYHVTFTKAEKMESNFKTADMYNQFSGMQPGDYTDVVLNIKNENEETVDWYMTNTVLKSLEDTREESALSGGAYTYILTYKNTTTGEEKILFSSDLVGGEDVSQGGEGLHEATDALEEWFYLDTLSNSQGGTITLRVALDGETQGNDYQDTLAELEMNFAVELRKAGITPEKPDEPDKPDEPEKKKSSHSSGGSSGGGGRVVRTGDDTNIIPYVIAAGVSGLAILLLAIYGLRERRRQRGGKA